MNRPNILSNDLDQVSKTRKRYSKELNNPELQQQIIDAFDKHDPDINVLGGNDFFIEATDEKFLSRLEINQQKLPMMEVLKMLKDNHGVVSCELCRKKTEKIGGWTEAVGRGMLIEDTVLGKVLTRDKEPIRGNIITLITFTKIRGDRITVKMSAKQVEFPAEGSLLPNRMVFSKELNGEQLEKEHIQL